MYRVILLMLEVSKVHRELSIQSNVTHVKGVESSSIYTKSCNAMFAKGVERSSKWSAKSFGKLRLRAFQPYHQILSMLEVSNMLQHTQHLVWLESPKSQLSKTFCRLKIH